MVQKEPWFPLFIFNNRDELIYDSYASPVVTIFPEESRFGRNQDGWFYVDTDYLQINLERDIGQPLEVAQMPAASDQAFAIGFPICTECEDVAPLPNDSRPLDSNGIEMYWTAGKFVFPEDAFDYLNIRADARRELLPMVFADADGVPGMSGGPILNSSGQVVAIVTGVKSSLREGKLVSLSRGARPPHWPGNNNLQSTDDPVDLIINNSGDFIKCAQEGLNYLGFRSGPPNGQIDGMTIDASKRYLSDNAESGLNAINRFNADIWCTELQSLN